MAHKTSIGEDQTIPLARDAISSMFHLPGRFETSSPINRSHLPSRNTERKDHSNRKHLRDGKTSYSPSVRIKPQSEESQNPFRHTQPITSRSPEILGRSLGVILNRDENRADVGSRSDQRRGSVHRKFLVMIQWHHKSIAQAVPYRVLMTVINLSCSWSTNIVDSMTLLPAAVPARLPVYIASIAAQPLPARRCRPKLAIRDRMLDSSFNQDSGNWTAIVPTRARKSHDSL
ncbi:uncharacterized protein EV420DRAFT_1535676 [Desarmillaria tabescens]|uniref:Uncharacterized protein n=1 Tax=Armillaria tabescens TaxID=1929756 RepID=A0AA39N7A6_ARMTA|nr:uncharacterized protein EV420DRAFT_1535676 [Desarmillaria tabescens]KAK0460219.1 hypothetical protein EV420DRAFT_1535676 [Desarmillaria tabescens]